MNANGLADELEDAESYVSQDIDDRDYAMICRAATMLRQQQLKIEALEDQVSDLKLKIFTRKKWGSDIVSDGGLDPRNEYEAKRKPAELTDEDILKIWRENEKVYPMDRSRILDRSRACIRKAQESNHEQIPDFFYMEHDIQGER